MQCIKVNGCDPNVTGVSAYLSPSWMQHIPLLDVELFVRFLCNAPSRIPPCIRRCLLLRLHLHSRTAKEERGFPNSQCPNTPPVPLPEQFLICH